jgi:hypothetical protein
MPLQLIQGVKMKKVNKSNKATKVIEDREAERKKFLIYEANLFGYMELERKGNLTKEQKSLCRKCKAHCRRYEKKRQEKLNRDLKSNAIKAGLALKKFYKTHKPPYNNEEKIFLITSTIASKKGRNMLATAMIKPIKAIVEHPNS